MEKLTNLFLLITELAKQAEEKKEAEKTSENLDEMLASIGLNYDDFYEKLIKVVEIVIKSEKKVRLKTFFDIITDGKTFSQREIMFMAASNLGQVTMQLMQLIAKRKAFEDLLN